MQPKKDDQTNNVEDNMSDVVDGLPLAGSGFSAPLTESVLSDVMSGFNSESEEALALRYSRPSKKLEELTFEFTRDPALLHQYYTIYENEFKAVCNIDYHHNENDEHDRHGHFLIARIGKLCIGGARLSTKTPRQPYPLPIEMDDFKIADHFPHLEQKQMRYGQIGRLCVLPQYRGGAITRMMMWHLFRKSVALGLDMIFATAPLVIARGHMKSAVSMGLKETKIHFDIMLPEYPMCDGVRFFLISVVLDKSIMEKAESVIQHKSIIKENA